MPPPPPTLIHTLVEARGLCYGWAKQTRRDSWPATLLSSTIHDAQKNGHNKQNLMANERTMGMHTALVCTIMVPQTPWTDQTSLKCHNCPIFYCLVKHLASV